MPGHRRGIPARSTLPHALSLPVFLRAYVYTILLVPSVPFFPAGSPSPRLRGRNASARLAKLYRFQRSSTHYLSQQRLPGNALRGSAPALVSEDRYPRKVQHRWLVLVRSGGPVRSTPIPADFSVTISIVPPGELTASRARALALTMSDLVLMKRGNYRVYRRHALFMPRALIAFYLLLRYLP